MKVYRMLLVALPVLFIAFVIMIMVMLTSTVVFAAESNVKIIEVEEDPAMEGFIYMGEIPLDLELQQLLWREAYNRGIDYTFALAVIRHESEFEPKATNYNKNGSTDKGLFQTNSCWWKTLMKEGMISESDDLYDAETGIKCGMWELQKYVDKYGNTERAYAAYNTGRDVKSNKNSQKVMEYWEAYATLLNQYHIG